MKGQVVYMYAYDVAYELDLKKAKSLIPGSEFVQLLAGKTVPRDFPFHTPLRWDKGGIPLKTSAGPVTLRCDVKAFSLGAVSIFLRLDFEAAGLGDLIGYHSLRLDDGRSLDDYAGGLAAEIREALRPAALRPTQDLNPEEAYTVFCLVKDVPGFAGKTAKAWLDDWRGEVAGLLTEEEAFDRLSETEIEETTRYNYSYATDDLLVVDWNGAMILDPDAHYEDLLYMLEVANVQLTEFQCYDRMLETFLDKAYGDVEGYSRKPPLLKGPGPILNNLKGVLMDLTKMAEEITNITKFFGDWHLARIYLGCSERFHLKEWENSLEGKLRTLDGLYKTILDDWNNRRMIMLEAGIVVLFVIDLLGIFLKK